MTFASFNLVQKVDDQFRYELKFLKQQHIYKNFTFDLNEVFGVDSTPYSKEEDGKDCVICYN